MKAKNVEFALTLPAFLWLVLFFAIPALIVVAFAFRPSDHYGALLPGWTLETIKILTESYYLKVLWRTIWISLLTTIIVLSLAIPIGYHIAKLSGRAGRILLLLIIVPFWTSFLIRVFAWKSLLHPEGYVKQLLLFFNIVQPETSLLYNKIAVILVMVYAYLPFGILPIYAAASKFEWQLLEAGVDLGCTPFQSFRKVFVPGIKRGIITAFLMVFIPLMGAYVIPDLVGSPTSEMLSNKIVQKILLVRNIPEAAALSLLLALVILLPFGLIALFQKRSIDYSSIRRNVE